MLFYLQYNRNVCIFLVKYIDEVRIMIKKVTNTIYYIGVNDHKIDLFEGQYQVLNGISYNSYLIEDEKIAIMDTVDEHFSLEWLKNIEDVLNDKLPSYLIVSHMEPDHSASIHACLKKYPQITIVGNTKTFQMIDQFFPDLIIESKLVVKENEQLNLGNHQLKFVFAPMVHWPEVMVTYDTKDKVLFSADGFGKFGALDIEEDWIDEARRYYIGIVGKYGLPVQNLLKKAMLLDIKFICPLHGPVLSDNLNYYLSLYDKWSKYESEEDGIVICFNSVYGHTKSAVLELVKALHNHEYYNVKIFDLARCDQSIAISEAFKYSKLVLASITYNGDLFPYMNQFINGLVERDFQNKKIAIIDNGTWAPLVAKKIKEKLSGCKNLVFCENEIKIKSALANINYEEINNLARELIE